MSLLHELPPGPHWLLLILAFAVAAAVPSAQAQEEICSARFTGAELQEALEAVDEAIANANGLLAQRILDDIYDATRCIDTLVDPTTIGRFARQNAFVAFYAQDIEEAEAWAQLAQHTLGATPWNERYPVTDSFLQLLGGLPAPTIRGPENAGFRRIKGGAAFVDGRYAESPEAAVGVPHLLQLLDKRRRPVYTGWIDGMAFPPEQLGNPSTPTRPRWVEDPPLPPQDVDPDLTEPTPPEPADPPIEQTEPVADASPPDPQTEADAPAAEPAETPPEATPPVPAPEDPPPAAPEPVLAFDEAQASRDCPWKSAPKRVSSTGRTVTVNRHTYAVKSLAEQATFLKVLRSCGEFRAARRFKRWREARANLFSFDAQEHRERMEKALLTEEPTRRRDR